MADDSTLLDPVQYDPPEESQRAELRDDLQRDLNADREQDLVADILACRQQGLDDRIEREDRWALDEKQYYGILPEKTFPWVGCSNLHVPLTMTGLETMKPRLIEAVLGDDTPILCRPVESQDQERAERVEQFLTWQLKTELDFAGFVTEASHRYLLPGTIVAKTRWRVDERHVKAVRSFPAETTMPDVLRDCFDGQVPRDLKKTGEATWSAWLKAPNGSRRDITLTLAFLEDALEVSMDTTERTFEGPWPELIDIQDFIVPINGGADPNRLPWCQHRLWWDERTLRDKARLGLLRADAVEQLLRGNPPSGDDGQMDATDLRATIANVEGVEAWGASSVRAEQYEILEDYRTFDVDGDGWPEEIVTWVCPALPQMILGWDYLDNLFAHGKRPFRVGRYFPIPGRFYGLSFAEVVKDLQTEINTIHNQRVDAGTVQNTPGGWYRASSTMDAGPMRYSPGTFRPIDDPQRDVRYDEWNGNFAWGQNEEALLWQMFERLTGITDLSLGRQPNRVGASRTATGVASLLSEAGLRFKTAMQGFQRFIRDVIADILALDQQYLPPGKEFRVTGRMPEMVRLSSKADIAGKYDLMLSTTTESMNRELMRQDITAKIQFAMNPVVIQTGLIGPKGLRYLARKYFLAYGEPDPDRILEPERADAVVRTPEQELAMWVNGQDVHPSMAEDLMGHYQAHQMQRMDPVVQIVLGPSGLAKIDAHVAETQRLLQMQAAVMAQAQKGPKGATPAVAGDQANNAAIGRQQAMGGAQAPAAMGPSAGGAMSPMGPRG